MGFVPGPGTPSDSRAKQPTNAHLATNLPTLMPTYRKWKMETGSGLNGTALSGDSAVLVLKSLRFFGLPQNDRKEIQLIFVAKQRLRPGLSS